MAGLYSLYENGELVGAYTISQIARMLEVKEATVYDAAAQRRMIKKTFTIEHTERQNIPDFWKSEKIAEWEEVRFRLNPQLRSGVRTSSSSKKPKVKKEIVTRRSVRYSASAVRFM